MTSPATPADNKQRLVQAAADLISASGPGAEVSLRSICDRVGVTLPTLYHYFGSKEGLIDAVVQHGFETYLAAKHAAESTGDPIADLRQGWDAHVAFGMENSAFYALMYGRTEPGKRSGPAREPYAMLLDLVKQATAQGRMRVHPVRAADHILAANVGVTLYLISEERPDLSLSDDIRDATFAAITTDSVIELPDHGEQCRVEHAAHSLRAALDTSQDDLRLRPAERALLEQWLDDLAENS